MLCYAERASRCLARTIFYAMVRHREALRDDQGRQNRIEVVGEDLLAIAATALYAESQERATGDATGWTLAEEFFLQARARIDGAISGLIQNDDQKSARLGERALGGEFPWLSRGIIRRGLDDYAGPAPDFLKSAPDEKTRPEKVFG
jgi:hypothetical protein